MAATETGPVYEALPAEATGDLWDRERPCQRCGRAFCTGVRGPDDYPAAFLGLRDPVRAAAVRAMVRVHVRRYCHGCCRVLLVRRFPAPVGLAAPLPPVRPGLRGAMRRVRRLRHGRSGGLGPHADRREALVGLPAALVAARLARGLSQEAAALAVGVDRSQWGKWETGLAPAPGSMVKLRAWLAAGPRRGLARKARIGA